MADARTCLSMSRITCRMAHVTDWHYDLQEFEQWVSVAAWLKRHVPS